MQAKLIGSRCVLLSITRSLAFSHCSNDREVTTLFLNIDTVLSNKKLVVELGNLML